MESSENEPYELIQKLLEFILEQPINKIIPPDFNAGITWIKAHFQFIDNNKLYTYKETGVSSDTYEEVPEFTSTETGFYEVTETEVNKGSIIFTPTGGTAYTVQWAILPPDGNLFLTYANGETIEFDVQRTANN